MTLPDQHMANKTQSHNSEILWLYESVLPFQVILLLASCSPAELASSSDYFANKRNYFEMWLLCRMKLTTEGGELLTSKVGPIVRFNPSSVFLNRHQIEIRVHDPLSRA
jgi:hypothetical protein